MSRDPTNEETTVFAIYSTRRDAELARDYLQDENIETAVRTDDAGGMYPQLQRPHGVKLVGLRPDAQDAYELLDAADLLPQPVEQRDEAADPAMSTRGVVGMTGVVVVFLILLYFLLA